MDRRSSSSTSSSAACRQRNRQAQQRFPLSADATTSSCSPGFLSAVFSESGNGEAGDLKRGSPFRHLNCTSAPDVYIPATAASVIRASADWQPKPARRPRPAHRRSPNLVTSSSSSSDSLSVRPRRRASAYADFWCSGSLPEDAISSTECLVPCEPTLRRFQHVNQDAVLPITINSTRGASFGEECGNRRCLVCLEFDTGWRNQCPQNLDDLVQHGVDAALGPSIYEMAEEPSFIVLPRRHFHSLHGLGFSHETFREDSHANIDQAADRFRDWRLDVDNMSYEELVDLGNKIGHVKTGLKEDEISVCVEKMNECPSEREGRCSICLEDYCNQGKEIAKLECEHEYHACCIKKWLQQKSICPICKGPVGPI